MTAEQHIGCKHSKGYRKETDISLAKVAVYTSSRYGFNEKHKSMRRPRTFENIASILVCRNPYQMWNMFAAMAVLHSCMLGKVALADGVLGREEPRIHPAQHHILHAESAQRYTIDPSIYQRRNPPTSPPVEISRDDTASGELASKTAQFPPGTIQSHSQNAEKDTSANEQTNGSKTTNSNNNNDGSNAGSSLRIHGVVNADSSNTNNQIKSTSQQVIANSREFQTSNEFCECENEWVEGGAKLAYLIVVHNFRTAEDALFLYKAIRRPNTIVLIHIDTKFPSAEFEKTSLYDEIVVHGCNCGAITQIHSIYDSQWGEWSMNDPTHWAMRLLVNDRETTFKFNDGTTWDVFINLSGDTMPTLIQSEISSLFANQLKGFNFVTSSSCETGLVPTNVYTFPSYWHKRKHYTHHPDGNPKLTYQDNSGSTHSAELTIHFGSQWMALTPEFVEYIVNSLAQKTSLPSQFKKWLQDNRKLMADETFIPTLLMNVPEFANSIPTLQQEGEAEGALSTLPSLFNIRYERMDEHAPTAFGWYPVDQRYDVPENSLADKPKVWGPYFLGVYDLANIKRSGALFVRKASTFLDPNLVHLLPVASFDDLPDIGWPPGMAIQLSPKPDWEATKAELMRKAKAKDEKKIKKKTSQEKETNKQKQRKDLEASVKDHLRTIQDAVQDDVANNASDAAVDENDEEFR